MKILDFIREKRKYAKMNKNVADGYKTARSVDYSEYEKKLAPCPFCGGKAFITYGFSIETNFRTPMYKARCSECGADRDEDFYTLDKAVENWNERKGVGT